MSRLISTNLYRNSTTVRSYFQQQKRLITAGSSNVEVKENFTSPKGEQIWKTYSDVKSYQPGNFQIQTINKISPKGLKCFPKDFYEIIDNEEASHPHAILLRSHKLKEEEVKHTVRAIARCGAGTNNIPVDRMSKMGIPVFNTPGANANAVKELILCGLFLGSRRILDGVNHMKQLGKDGLARERVEKDKSKFGGRELTGRTLAVIGLGHIGASTARDAARLGMNIVGYDPHLSVESALKLPRRPIKLADSIVAAVKDADYISLNIPYIKGENGTHGIINKDVISHFPNHAVLLNFARGELVDSEALKEFLDSNESGGRYITDFPEDLLWDHKNVIVIPHLGASTAEAEEAAAAMAASTIRDFLESGTIKNSVNFPSTSLPTREPNTIRFTIVNDNVPGMLSKILDVFSKHDLNIVQQINQSKNMIAYTVLDVDLTQDHEDNNVVSLKHLQEELTMLNGVLSSRIIYGVAGSGYAKNIEGEYFY